LTIASHDLSKMISYEGKLTLFTVLLIFISLLIHPAIGQNTDCEPNADLTGIDCLNLTLYQTKVFNNSFWVGGKLQTVFDHPGSNWFVTHIWIYVTFLHFQDKLWAEFTFNSSTPNNTWLATGSTRIGTFELPTGDSNYPTIAVELDAIHNVTLLTSDCPQDPSNNEYCEWGTLEATLGLNALGLFDNNQTRIVGILNEPSAVVVWAPFKFSVDEKSFCADLAEEIVYNKDMQFEVGICLDETPCWFGSHAINASTWDRNKTFADNQCFDHSFTFA